MIRRISKTQFDAYCYSRQPLIRMLAREVDWYEAYDKKLLGIVTLDLIDRDFGFVILGRDKRKLFRAIDITRDFYQTPEQATDELKIALQKYKDDNKEYYSQGDEKELPNEIFVSVAEEDKLHDYYKVLRDEARYEAARNIIKEIIYSFIDIDGHYIKEFQTSGFNARLWELYLYVYLYNEGFEIIRKYNSPDYHLITHSQEEVFIEAVTVNPTSSLSRPDAPEPKNQDEVNELTNDYMPIKFGSPLYSKLKKEYWKLDHVRDKPLIIAIHDFHNGGSMTWSRTALQDYLYGVRLRIKEDNGSRRVTQEKIETHSWLGKTIPSGFFTLPDSENISAVLFNNSATIPKFNRMGKLAGLGSKDIIMFRQGYMFNPEPNAFDPIPFSMDIDSPDYQESWSDSLIMFHNPYAVNPINPDMFHTINHVIYDVDNQNFLSINQPFHILSSITTVLMPMKSDKEESKKA